MFSASPEYRYLRDVLGLQHFIRPEGGGAPFLVAVEDLKAQAAIARSTGFVVIADRELSPAENDLLKKMLGSIQVDTYDVVVTENAPADILQAEGVIFVSSTNTFNQSTSSPSVNIADFYAMASEDGHPTEIMAYKKAAWAELQKFKKQLKKK